MKSQFERIEGEVPKLSEEIRKDLVLAYFKEPIVSEEESEDWKKKFAANLESLLAQRPDLISLYAADRKKAIAEIESELYDKEK